MKKETIIITGASFAIGLAEALIYYNMGKGEKEGFSLRLPPGRELAKTAGVVIATSVLTALLTLGIENGLKGKPVWAKA